MRSGLLLMTLALFGVPQLAAADPPASERERHIGRNADRDRWRERHDDRDSHDWDKERREAARDAEKDYREAVREREKDRREGLREAEKDYREAIRERGEGSSRVVKGARRGRPRSVA
jgi:hypothetical protein